MTVKKDDSCWWQTYMLPISEIKKTIQYYLQDTPWRIGPKDWICWLDSWDSPHKPAYSGNILSLKGHFESHASTPCLIQCLLHKCSFHTKLCCTGTWVVHHLKWFSSNSQHSCFKHRFCRHPCMVLCKTACGGICNATRPDHSVFSSSSTTSSIVIKDTLSTFY